MSATHVSTEASRLVLASGYLWSVFSQCRRAFQERREREKLRGALYQLNDLDLKDIGISRGEIEYFVSNSSIDPRNIRG